MRSATATAGATVMLYNNNYDIAAHIGLAIVLASGLVDFMTSSSLHQQRQQYLDQLEKAMQNKDLQGTLHRLKRYLLSSATDF